MTVRNSVTNKPAPHQTFGLPDPPDREPEDMTSFSHLNKNGAVHHLTHHFGKPETTIIEGERYLTRVPSAPASDRMAPDLLIAFNANPDTYRNNNGYVISEQGKPPNFVLEIASRRTGQKDVETKRPAYAALGIPEYWRFDQTGEFHGAPLAGDRLVHRAYEPIPIAIVEEGVLQGYSAVLDLLIRWEHGELRWHDPKTGEHIVRLSDALDLAESEREARTRAEAQRARAEAQRNAEQEARTTAEARVRELEAEIARRERES